MAKQTQKQQDTVPMFSEAERQALRLYEANQKAIAFIMAHFPTLLIKVN